MRGGSDAVFLATEGKATVAGYLVGAVQNPGLQDRFADIGYFHTDFAELCRLFPAHLHINLAPAFRSRGVGARLIDAFADYAARQGAAGMHIVTGAGMRNVCFTSAAASHSGRNDLNGHEVVFLGRALHAPQDQASSHHGDNARHRWVACASAAAASYNCRPFAGPHDVAAVLRH
jgi:GNAT superfamily N-acetyltransferase